MARTAEAAAVPASADRVPHITGKPPGTCVAGTPCRWCPCDGSWRLAWCGSGMWRVGSAAGPALVRCGTVAHWIPRVRRANLNGSQGLEEQIGTRWMRWWALPTRHTDTSVRRRPHRHRLRARRPWHRSVRPPAPASGSRRQQQARPCGQGWRQRRRSQPHRQQRTTRHQRRRRHPGPTQCERPCRSNLSRLLRRRRLLRVLGCCPRSPTTSQRRAPTRL